MDAIEKESFLNQLRNVENKLSPENLCCDGEASPSYVRREGARLNRIRRGIIAQLGYEPSFNELYHMT
jgi:hypothetical protein